jgi:hypothetical protein
LHFLKDLVVGLIGLILNLFLSYPFPRAISTFFQPRRLPGAETGRKNRMERNAGVI